MRLIQKLFILVVICIFSQYALKTVPTLFNSPAFAMTTSTVSAENAHNNVLKPSTIIYAIQTSSYHNEDDAWQLVDEFRAKGIKSDVYLLKDKKGQIWHVVIAGTYRIPKDAEEVSKRIRNLGRISSIIIPYNRDSLEQRKLVRTKDSATKAKEIGPAEKNAKMPLAKTYSVQVSACRYEENALAIVSELVSKGYTPEVYIPTVKTKQQSWYLVLLGFYDTRDSAEQVAQSYSKREHDEAIVKVFDRKLLEKLKLSVDEVVGKEENYSASMRVANGVDTKVVTTSSPKGTEASTYEMTHEEERENQVGKKKEEFATEVKKNEEEVTDSRESTTTPKNFFAYTPPVNEFKVAVSLSNYSYEEPDVMKVEGMLYGIFGSYTYTYKEALMLRVDGSFHYGSMEYTSENLGDQNGIPNYLMEYRLLMGPDLFPLNKVMITPYIGIGYRYLNDDSSGDKTSLGYEGFLRESNYYYVPIGISATTGYIQGWIFSLLIEYDYLGKGRQKNYTSRIGSTFDVVNYQIYGYAMKCSLSCRKQEGKMDYLIEPFITYWNIKQSEDVLEPDQYLYYEPRNNTLQYGISIGLLF